MTDEKPCSLPRSEQLSFVEQWALLKLVGLASICTEGCQIAEQVLEHRWQTALSAMTEHDEVVAIVRSAMRSFDAVLSGSRCVAIFDDKKAFTPGDWDWYVADYGYDLFVQFIKDHLDGTVIFQSSDYSAHAKHAVPSFTQDSGITHRTRIRTPRGTHDVICSRTSSPLLPLALFHSSIVMNFFTADGFCIEYPDTFFARVSVKARRSMVTSDHHAFAKYEQRGYTFIDIPPHFVASPVEGECSRGYCPRTVRRFGDEFSLAFVFKHQKGDQASKLHPSYPARVSWRRGGHGCGGDDCQGEYSPVVYSMLLLTPR